LLFFRFQYFYPKTGVTGPYVFGAGMMTYFLSKEIYVMEHEYYSGLSILAMVVYATKKFGPGLAAYLDKEVDVSSCESFDASGSVLIKDYFCLGR
jgi:F-type H+-transporting ATPase subunit b